MKTHIRDLFAGALGILYLASGLVETLSGMFQGIAELTAPFLVPADIIGGLVLCVIAAVYLSALYRSSVGTGYAQAYLYVGMALSVIIGTVAFLSIGAKGADILIFGDGEPWDPAAFLVPMVYLAILPAAGLSRWRSYFFGSMTGGTA